MSKEDRVRLSNRRFIMGNPYALIEHLVDDKADADGERAALIALQNPYAFLNSDDEAPGQRFAMRRTKRTFREIEALVTNLQRQLWARRFELWPDVAHMNPVDVLDPTKAAELLGFNLEHVDSLGVFSGRTEKVSVAGLIDWSKKTIRVSREFAPQAQNFTAAHELGHAVLHAGMALHRDRAIDGPRVARDGNEVEADKFATYFLLPKKLIEKAFRERFLAATFALTEDAAFALAQRPADEVARTFGGRRGLSRGLASATQFNGRHFYSLAEQFNVTVEAMAIRLEELQLIA